MMPPKSKHVTVEMLARWIAYAEDGLVSTPIKLMRAAIAQMGDVK